MPRQLLAVLVTAILLLTGCTSGDEQPTDEPRSSSSSTASSPAGDPTAAASVEPATGPLIEGDFFSYRLPGDLAGDAEWLLARNGFTAVLSGDEIVGQWSISAGTQHVQSGQEDLDTNYELGGDSDAYSAPLVRGENRTVAGVEAWTAEVDDDTIAGTSHVYVLGAVYQDRTLKLTFVNPVEDRSVGDAYRESVLASLTWK